MELSDFQRRMLGFPAQALGNVASAFTADPNAPVEQQDMANARWGTLGQMGALLFAAGQPQTDQSRAALLSRLASVNTPDELAMNAAQRRLYGLKMQQAQTEMARQEQTREMLKNPAIAQTLGVTPELLQVIGEDGVRKLAVERAALNSPDAVLRRQVAQAQLDNLRAPNIGVIGQDADGNPIYGDQRTGAPLKATPAAPAMPATSGAMPSMPGTQIPPDANPKEYRMQVADQAAKAAAAEAAQKKYIEEQFNPALADYDKAVRDGIAAGAFGPGTSSKFGRTIGAFSDAEAARKRVEQAGNRLTFELAKRASGGKLDSKGLTEGEYDKYAQQLVPLDATKPLELLDALDKNYGYTPPPLQPTPQSQTSTASDPLSAAREAIRQGAPREAVIQRLRENGIDTTGL